MGTEDEDRGLPLDDAEVAVMGYESIEEAHKAARALDWHLASHLAICPSCWAAGWQGGEGGMLTKVRAGDAAPIVSAPRSRIVTGVVYEGGHAPGKFLTAAEVAVATGNTKGTVAWWRHVGKGPKYLKIGQRVGYAPADVEAWIAARDARKRDQFGDLFEPDDGDFEGLLEPDSEGIEDLEDEG